MKHISALLVCPEIINVSKIWLMLHLLVGITGLNTLLRHTYLCFLIPQ